MLYSVVDSSVWIDFFNKKKSLQTEEVKSKLINYSDRSPFVILPIIYQEILQGILNDNHYELVKEVLEGIDKMEIDHFFYSEKSADLYRYLRKKGITIRKANDCFIASVCIDYDYPLLHNDKDFNNIAKHTSLKIYK